MNTSKAAVKTLTAVIALALAGLASATPARADDTAASANRYQTVSPLGFEIPAPGVRGAAGPVHADTSAIPKGVSPLGFEIPAPTPAGAQGRARSDTLATAPAGLRDPGALSPATEARGVRSPLALIIRGGSRVV
jgi:hypothetical protein